MSFTYPLPLPSDRFSAVRPVTRDVVSVATSPFTLTDDVQTFGGQKWEVDFELPPLRRADDAAAWIAFLLALKGRSGTFLAHVDPLSNAPRGTWAGSPLVMGAHAAGVAAVALDGFTAGATIKAGDYLQFGTGASSRLHQVLQDVTANGSGQATIDIWPNLRVALSDNATIVTSNPRAVWRRASNEFGWDIATAQMYGIRFSAVEAL